MTDEEARRLLTGGTIKLNGGPAVEPVTAGGAVAALEALCPGGGAPRWAAVAWAPDVVGPGRSGPRISDDGTSSRDALEELLVRGGPPPPPPPPRQELPG